MVARSLSRLEPVDIRAAWPDEARDFTPWLAANTEYLSEALGMNLERVDTEVGVGDFSSDLVLTDTDTGATVAVENLLGPSDHDHLGKLLTYAAGLDASYAVLVAQRLRPEHRSALQWLNTHSVSGVGYFGIEIEVWRIGDSEPAPRLTMVVEPDEWGREARASTTLTPTQAAYRDWWSEFLPAFREAYPGWSNSRTPSTGSWMTFPSGKSGIHYQVSFCWPTGQEPGLRVELYLDPRGDRSADEVFQILHAQSAQIHERFGGELHWELLQDSRANRIAAYFDESVHVTDEDRWAELRAWAIETAGRLKSALQPSLDMIGMSSGHKAGAPYNSTAP